MNKLLHEGRLAFNALPKDLLPACVEMRAKVTSIGIPGFLDFTSFV